MIDEGQEQAGTGADVPFARTYDFYKHLTGIALVSVGGVFAFLDGDGTRLDPRRVVVVLGALGVSAVTSLLLAAWLAGLESRPQPHALVVRRVRTYGSAAICFLAIGLGGFIQTFASAMLK